MNRVHDDQHFMRHPYWIKMTYFYNPDNIKPVTSKIKKEDSYKIYNLVRPTSFEPIKDIDALRKTKHEHSNQNLARKLENQSSGNCKTQKFMMESSIKKREFKQDEKKEMMVGSLQNLYFRNKIEEYSKFYEGKLTNCNFLGTYEKKSKKEEILESTYWF